MRPSALLLRLTWTWAAVAVLPVSARFWLSASAGRAEILWWCITASLIFIAALDSRRRNQLQQIDIVRRWPESLAMGIATPVELEIGNRGTTPLLISIREDVPASVDLQEWTDSLSLQPATSVRLRYRVLAHRRGDIDLGPVWLRVSSRWKLWEFGLRRGAPLRVKVYPNFATIGHFATLGIDAQIGAMGIHLQHRRGEGMDFHQLRNFREGDALRQIDWKATARYQKPISREYQDERDQDVIFLLDCGRRMRTLDGELSHFDYALNAVLLTGYIALRQGDAVGLMTHAGSERWLPPQKSQSSINRLLKHVYDLHSSTATSDFVQAAQQLLNRHRKRSLIIIVSDIRDEDRDDLRAACRLLSSRHLVVVASLREAILDEQKIPRVRNFTDALRYSGIAMYRSQRAESLQALRRNDIAVIDCLPQNLHVDLVSQYLMMKRSGAI